MGRHAHRGEPSRDEVHPAPQVVGGAQVDEAALDRRFAEEHRRSRPVARQGADGRDHELVEPDEVVGGAAPGHLHLAVAGRELSGRLRERAVLHHEPPGEHCREHRGARDHTERDECKPVSAATQPGGDEPQGIGDATQKHR